MALVSVAGALLFWVLSANKKPPPRSTMRELVVGVFCFVVFVFVIGIRFVCWPRFLANTVLIMRLVVFQKQYVRQSIY